MTPQKKVLVILCVLAAAAVVSFAVLRPDRMGLSNGLDLDSLDWDDAEWSSSLGPITFSRYLDADIEAVRQAASDALEELGYSQTDAGPAKRPDGAQLDIDVTERADGRVALELTVGAKLEQTGDLEEGAAKPLAEEAARLGNEFFTALARHLE